MMIYFGHAQKNSSGEMCALHGPRVWATKELADAAITNSIWQRVIPLRVEEIAGGGHIATTLDGKFWMFAEREF